MHFVHCHHDAACSENAYFASLDGATGSMLVHYVRTASSSQSAYLVHNEKLGVLLWYFVRCVANHCAMSNTLHCLLSVGGDSSAEYLEFLDVTKIEIYNHDAKSCYAVAQEYAAEAVIAVEYRADGMGAIAFSEAAVEKLQFVSESAENEVFTVCVKNVFTPKM